MNRLLLKSKLTRLTAIAILLLGALLYGCVQDKTSTVSGRVVDVEGKPIADLHIAAIPDQDIRPYVLKQRNNKSELKNRELGNEWQTDETDESGQFFITDIIPGPISIGIVHQLQMQATQPLKSDYNTISTKVGERTFYPTITFAIEPGEHIENVEITVRPRMRIRGQIVFADGTPLSSAMVHYTMQQRNLNGGDGSGVGSFNTDDAGYFVIFVDYPGFYTIEIQFQGLSATSERLSLETRQSHDGLVLKLDSAPIPINATPNRVTPDTKGVWVLNPTNGHSYKRVHCNSWKEAQAKAAAEDAYLVSINNEAEQQWLLEVFGTYHYWIGLTDVAKEGEWRWTSGEPVTYTNWAPY